LRWRKLAGVPQDKFEAALADSIEKPTMGGIIRSHKVGDRARVHRAADQTVITATEPMGGSPIYA
jgi:hypothetical protein